MVKVAFVDKDQRVLPEMSATVAFLSREPPEPQISFLALPADAIVKSGEGSVVYVVRGRRAEQVTIEVTEKYGDMVSVRNGLRAGDKVILNHAKVRDGTKVTVAE